MAITLVPGSATSAAPGTNNQIVVAWSAAQSVGDLLVFRVSSDNSTTIRITSVTDTAGNQYNVALGPTRNGGTAAVGTAWLYWAVCKVAQGAGANTLTINFSANNLPSMAGGAWTGFTATPSLFAKTAATGNSDTGSATVATPNTDWLVVAGMTATVTVVGVGGGATNVVTDPAGNNIEYIAGTGAGSQTPTATTAPSTGKWIFDTASFGVSQGGGLAGVKSPMGPLRVGPWTPFLLPQAYPAATPATNPVANPAGIPTGEVDVGGTLSPSVAPAGIPPFEVVIGGTVTLTAAPAGIPSFEVDPGGEVIAFGLVNPAGIPTGEVVAGGSTSLRVAPAGIPTGEVDLGGSLTPSVAPAGIPSFEVDPGGSISPSGVAPAGIPTFEMVAGGSASLRVAPAGIPTGEVDPGGSLGGMVAPAGIPTGEVDPGGVLAARMAPAGIPTGEVDPGGFVAPSGVMPAGIPTDETFGSSAVVPTAHDIVIAGMPSFEVVAGGFVVPSAIAPAGIPTGEVVPGGSIQPEVAPAGIPTGEVVPGGEAILFGRVDPAGIPTGEVVAGGSLIPFGLVDPAGIPTGEVVPGGEVIPFGRIDPAGIPTGEVFGGSTVEPTPAPGPPKPRVASPARPSGSGGGVPESGPIRPLFPPDVGERQLRDLLERGAKPKAELTRWSPPLREEPKWEPPVERVVFPPLPPPPPMGGEQRGTWNVAGDVYVQINAPPPIAGPVVPTEGMADPGVADPTAPAVGVAPATPIPAPIAPAPVADPVASDPAVVAAIQEQTKWIKGLVVVGAVIAAGVWYYAQSKRRDREPVKKRPVKRKSVAKPAGKKRKPVGARRRLR